MIISQSRNFVFVHTPKCAGRTFRQFVDPYHDYPFLFWYRRQSAFLNIELDYAHLRAWEVNILFPDVFQMLLQSRSLTFFRDPAERYLSAIYEHFDQYRPEVRLPAQPIERQKELIREFSAEIRPEMAITDPRYVHFSPQKWFTHMGDTRVVKYILPLKHDYDAVGAAFGIFGIDDKRTDKSTARKVDVADMLGEKVIQQTYRMYAQDWEIWVIIAPLNPFQFP